jgi:hypothetical protein
MITNEGRSNDERHSISACGRRWLGIILCSRTFLKIQCLNNYISVTVNSIKLTRTKAVSFIKLWVFLKRMPVSKFWHIHGYILLLFVQDVRVMYTPTCTCACVARTTHVTVLPGLGVLDYIATYTVRAVDHRCNFPVVQSRCHRLVAIVPPLCCWAVPGIVGHAITCLIVILKHNMTITKYPLCSVISFYKRLSSLPTDDVITDYPLCAVSRYCNRLSALPSSSWVAQCLKFVARNYG